MSLLEDVFLQDEANEAEELERVIEGDEFEERRRSDSDENSEKEDEAEEDKRRVDPTKPKSVRVIKNPRFILNPARLTGPRGIQVIPEHFKDFKFKGKGHEKEDLDLVLKRLEHWAYRLYPKFQFEDCLKKIETLGKKRPVAVHLHKIRSDQFLSEDTVVQKDSSDDEGAPTSTTPVQQEDEFDKLLQQQIDLARSTPAPNSAKKPNHDGSISPKDRIMTSLKAPKVTSSPSINNEQRERMLRSRKLAEERRLARLKNVTNMTNTTSTDAELVNNKLNSTENVENSIIAMEKTTEIHTDADEIAIVRKDNRSNVIDSSDEETEMETCVSIVADVHPNNSTSNENKEDKLKSQKANNDNSHIDSDETQLNDIENVTEDSTNTNFNSVANEGNNSSADINENIDGKDSLQNNTSLVYKEKDSDTLCESLNISNQSDENHEPLKYDDSDINIETNDYDNLIVNDKNTVNDNDLFDDLVRQNEQDISNGINTEVLDSSGKSNVENVPNLPKEIPIDVDKDNIESNFVPEEVIDDVMDVDFNDDF